MANQITQNKLDHRKVILTPIAKNKHCLGSGKPDSNRDYEEQQERTMKGEPWMWDDGKKNQAQIGDIFGFVHNFDKIIFHKVTVIHPITGQLPSWAIRPSRHINQRNRKILCLSKEIDCISWNTLNNYGVYKVQGTTYVNKKNKKELNNFILSHF